jgi:hypothetical protein
VTSADPKTILVTRTRRAGRAGRGGGPGAVRGDARRVARAQHGPMLGVMTGNDAAGGHGYGTPLWEPDARTADAGVELSDILADPVRRAGVRDAAG